MKAHRYKRANKAVRVLREFLQKHMKCENVLIGRYLNMKILEHGRKNIPHHVEVRAVKEKIKEKDKEIEVVKAELVGAPIEEKEPEKEKKKEKVEEKEIEKIIKEKEKEKEKVEHRPKEKMGKLPTKASEDVAQGILNTRVTKTQKHGHLKPKEMKKGF